MKNQENQTAELTTFTSWLARIGVSGITGTRWRKEGKVQTLNINGRVYISRDAAELFAAKARDGEFAKVHKSPFRADIAQLTTA
jgi:hypothetical protein